MPYAPSAALNRRHQAVRVGQFRDYLDTLAETDLRFEPILHRRQA